MILEDLERALTLLSVVERVVQPPGSVLLNPREGPLRHEDASMNAVNATPETLQTVGVEPPESTARVIRESQREPGRPRRLRARRVRAEELHLEGLEVAGNHATIGAFRGSVEDLSLTGLALTLAGAAGKGNLILHGDRLERLEVRCRNAVLYQGDAHVRRVTERGSDLVVGVEVQSSRIDLSELYRLGQKHSFSERLFSVLDPEEDDVADEFKVWVTNFRTWLERLKGFLDAEERALETSDQFSREEALNAYLAEASPRLIARLNQASTQLCGLVSGLAEEEHPIYRSYYKAQVLPLLSHSPLLRRAHTKPLGYAGDYEMMNMLYRNHAEGASLFGKLLNVYAAQERAAQANINRLEYLGQKIRSAIEVRGRVRLASIGCGPARELGVLLEQHPELGQFIEVALIDQEERVLTYCERTLSPLALKTGLKVQFIGESVRRLLTTRKLREALGERDFIYSAGLFDYLNHRSFQALLAVLYDALAPGGHMIIGNVATHNPSRYFMEYCLDWFLIHRSPEDLREFAAILSPRPIRVEVDAEPTGVNLFLRIWK
jgi:extracellular factor (EF) 3-hydroxypalmitic acid methyl ester biosynthesis protein